MGCNPKVFQRMTPEQRKRYMRRVMRLHLQLTVCSCVGMMFLGLGLLIAALVHSWRVAG